MEGIDLGPTVQIAAGPVHGVQTAIDVGQRQWTIDGLLGELRRAQALIAEHALDGRHGRQVLAQTERTQFGLNGAWSDQTHPLARQPSTGSRDQSPDLHRYGLGQAVRATRLSAQTCGALMQKAGSPLGEPTVSAFDALKDEYR